MSARSHVRARAARGKCSLTRSRGGFVWQLKKLTKEMFSIMYASRGVGLAAPQLGVNRRLMVFNPEGDPKRWVSEVRRLHSKPPPGRQPQPPCRSPPPPSFPSDLGARQVVLCNPEIIESSDATDVEEEGCLSFPGFTADVRRSEWIKVAYENLKGKKQKKKLSGWEARIFLHEFDHLTGTLYIDRLDESERQRVQPNLDELIAAHGEGGAL